MSYFQLIKIVNRFIKAFSVQGGEYLIDNQKYQKNSQNTHNFLMSNRIKVFSAK